MSHINLSLDQSINQSNHHHSDYSMNLSMDQSNDVSLPDLETPKVDSNSAQDLDQTIDPSNGQPILPSLVTQASTLPVKKQPPKKRYSTPGATTELTRHRLMHLDLIEVNPDQSVSCLPCKFLNESSSWRGSSLEKSGTAPIVIHIIKNHCDDAINLLADLHSRPELLAFRSSISQSMKQSPTLDLSGPASSSDETTLPPLFEAPEEPVSQPSNKPNKKAKTNKRPLASVVADQSVDDDDQIYPTEPPIFKPTLPAIYKQSSFAFDEPSLSSSSQSYNQSNSPSISESLSQSLRPARSPQSVFASAVQFFSCVGLDWKTMKHESFNQLINHSIPPSFEITHETFCNELNVQSTLVKQQIVESFVRTNISITLSIDFEEKQPYKPSFWVGSLDPTSKHQKIASNIHSNNQAERQYVIAHILMHAAGRTWLWSSINIPHVSFSSRLSTVTINQSVKKITEALSLELDALNAIVVENPANKLVKQSLGLGAIVCPPYQSTNQICASLSNMHDLIPVPTAGHSINQMIDAIVGHHTIAKIIEPFQHMITTLQSVSLSQSINHLPGQAQLPSSVVSFVDQFNNHPIHSDFHHHLKHLVGLKSACISSKLVSPAVNQSVSRITETNWLELADLIDVLKFFEDIIQQLENPSVNQSNQLDTPTDNPVLHKNTIYATIRAYHQIMNQTNDWDSLKPFRVELLRSMKWTSTILPIIHRWVANIQPDNQSNNQSNNVVLSTIAWLALGLRPHWITYNHAHQIHFVMKYAPLLARTQYRHNPAILHSVNSGEYGQAILQQANEFDVFYGPFARTPEENQAYIDHRFESSDYWWARTSNRQTQLLAHFALAMFGIAALPRDVEEHRLAKIEQTYCPTDLTDNEVADMRRMQISHPNSQQYIDKYVK